MYEEFESLNSLLAYSKLKKVKTAKTKINYESTEEKRLTRQDYHNLEYHRVRSKVNDCDMLLFQIEDALARGDKDLFILLTDRLRGKRNG